ncbi:MAG TPA: universal stress protein [Gaiellaceae bacterium]|nr:universal stress protein [Gaiellaceae bacterium]
MTGTILCDVTDPLAGASAAEFAAAVGARLGLRLVLVHVRAGVAQSSQASGPPPSEQALAAIADRLGHDAETRVAVGGDHAEALARVADEEGADLIVVGARPVGMGGRNLRAALARDLEAATPVPVLVAPPSTRRRSGQRLATR